MKENLHAHTRLIHTPNAHTHKRARNTQTQTHGTWPHHDGADFRLPLGCVWVAYLHLKEFTPLATRANLHNVGTEFHKTCTLPKKEHALPWIYKVRKRKTIDLARREVRNLSAIEQALKRDARARYLCSLKHSLCRHKLLKRGQPHRFSRHKLFRRGQPSHLVLLPQVGLARCDRGRSRQGNGT